MGTVLQFRHPTPRLRSQELCLLSRLCGSLQVMWRGGWAEPGEPDGVVLLKNQNCIGLWLYQRDCFAFVPIETGVTQLQVATVDQAHNATLRILGELLPD
jgi:hypothetical protein